MYIIIIEQRRWKFLPWPKVESFFIQETTSFSEVKDFVNGLRREFADNPYRYVFRIGVVRGQNIERVH